jgi:hypothetical protein
VAVAKYKWEFLPRFRAKALGWNGSRAGIERLHEAVKEIQDVALRDPLIAADGAVRLMERIWPAFQHVDTSSGALGGAVNWAVAQAIPILTGAPLDSAGREGMLERLWQAIQEDGVDYLSVLEYRWGEVCGSPEMASQWADRFLPLLRKAWPDKEHRSYFNGTSVCLSSLLAAGRYDELLELLALGDRLIWPWRRYGILVLKAQGKIDEALAYAEAQRGFNTPMCAVDRECEAILLAAGRREEAYARYAIGANELNTGMNWFRRIAAKYPEIPPRRIIGDLAARSPDPGLWFAAAKTAGFLDLALDFAKRGTTDPRTLSRASRDFLKSDPEFAAETGRLAVERMFAGDAYKITAEELSEAAERFLAAATRLNAEAAARADLQRIIDSRRDAPAFLRIPLARRSTA